MSVVGMSSTSVDGQRSVSEARSCHGDLSTFYRAAFDRSFAVLALLFFLPFMVVIAIAIYLTDRGPIMYGHRRVGKDGRPFRCLKFRTMAKDADARLATLLTEDANTRREWSRTMKLRDDPRVTPIGRFLRKSSLDELPQFINVLRGEMSVVGPRPIVEDEIWRYGEDYDYYCAVRPGITGVWQISGRNDVDYRSRVEMDIEFVRNRSFTRDLMIIAGTIVVMFKGRGAY